MQKGMYTIDKDLEIISHPQLDIERYFRLGHYLTQKEISYLENYISSHGANAYVKLNRKKKSERIQIIPITSETVSQISTTKDSTPNLESKREIELKEVMHFLTNNPFFKIQPIDPSEFLHFCRYIDIYYHKFLCLFS